jgi:glycosyltransferase involved in cell wall biosynthesis
MPSVYIHGRVSFVIPAYNCTSTIEEAVESIINGNFEPGDEVVIVDDFSTDNTKEVLNNLKVKYPFLHIIYNKKNKGCPATRNIGIKNTTNLLIFNLDSDDVLVPGSRKLLQNYMYRMKADIAVFGESHFFVDSVKNVTHKWICHSGIMTLADYLSGSIVPGGNYLYTKASWERVGGYWEYGKGLHEFWGFSLKQIAMGSKFVVLKNSYYYHRYGRSSLYIRQVRKENSSLMATKMIGPFLNFIDEKDAKYIKSREGRKTWFDNLENHPIKVKGYKIGHKGEIIHVRHSFRKRIFGIISRIFK